jgi:hypothetical protein
VLVTPSTATLEVGKTVAFTAQAFDAEGEPVAATFTWRSSENSTATVDASGSATGVATGAAEITAEVAEIRSTPASLTVTAAMSVAGPSSFAKIDAAFRSGALDEASALLYRMFATFRDPRLPAEYQGDDSTELETDAFDLVYSRWSALSDAAKEALEPFLVPPIYVGSSASPPMTAAHGKFRPQGLTLPICQRQTIDPKWAAKPDGSGGRVKVWYHAHITDHDKMAEMLVNELETKIWPTLIDALGMKAPLSDGAMGGCNGGDGRLDFYLVDMATSGQTATALGETLPVQPSTERSKTRCSSV